MNEYPEHIDQIDDFYRNQLADLEIEPPEGLWDKIKLGAANTSNPEVEIAPVILHGNSYNKTKRYLFIGTAALLFLGAVYFVGNNSFKETETNLPPSTEKTIESDRDSVTTIQQHSEKTIPSTSSSDIKRKNVATENIKSKSEDFQIIKEEEKVIPMSSEEINSTQSNPQPIQTTDSIADIVSTPKAAKEKVKFKDKYKKEYQDSTRNIFVPGK